MISFIRKLFIKDQVVRSTYHDPVLGKLEYNPAEKEWMTSGDSDEAMPFIGIKGDQNMPDSDSLNFIKSKLNNIQKYYDLCSDDLLYIARDFIKFTSNTQVKELYEIRGIWLEVNEWKINFRTRKKFTRVDVDMVFEGEKLTGNYIST